MPLTDRLATAAGKLHGAVRHVLGGLWALPKVAVTVMVFALLLNLIANFSGGTVVGKSIGESAVYCAIDAAVLEPFLKSGFAGRLPVLLSDTFREATATLETRNIHLVRYFNGMTLSDAICSNAGIDAEAAKLVGKETEPVKKAKLLYAWVAQNIKYDDKKAADVEDGKSGIQSGAVAAFQTRMGHLLRRRLPLCGHVPGRGCEGAVCHRPRLRRRRLGGPRLEPGLGPGRRPVDQR